MQALLQRTAEVVGNALPGSSHIHHGDAPSRLKLPSISLPDRLLHILSSIAEMVLPGSFDSHYSLTQDYGLWAYFDRIFPLRTPPDEM